MSTAMRALRRWSHKAGFDVRRWPALDPFYENLIRLLEVQSIDIVLDVGGNEGQYVRNLRRAGYGGQVVSVEPASGTHARLVEASADDACWEVAPPMALGDRDGTITLNLFNRSDMNSIHEMNGIAKDVFPKLDPVGTETVTMRRLDGVLEQLMGEARNPFLKLDTQGAELAILEGAAEVLSRVPVIQAEMSLMPLYEGAVGFDGVHDFLRANGFRMEMTAPVTFSRSLGRQVELDAVFVR